MIEVTIDAIVEDLRHESELLFGTPMNDWKYSGLTFKDDGPYLDYYPEIGEIKICLSNRVKSDSQQLLFQLTHEVCHLLHPSRTWKSQYNNKTLIINEGICSYFQVRKMNDFFGRGQATSDSLKELNPEYYEAYVLVSDLIIKDPDSIKKLRIRKPRIDELELTDFSALNFKVAESTKRRLLSHF